MEEMIVEAYLPEKLVGVRIIDFLPAQFVSENTYATEDGAISTREVFDRWMEFFRGKGRPLYHLPNRGGPAQNHALEETRSR